MSEPYPFLLGWLLTYLLHSTVLIGGAWLLLRFVRMRSNALRETLWTVALCGGLVTATVQTWQGVRPVGGTLLLPSRVVPAADAGEPGPAPPPASADSIAAQEVPGMPNRGTGATALALVSPEHAGELAVPREQPAGSAASLSPAPARRSWWVVAALAGALLLAGLYWLATRNLADRLPLADGALRARLDLLCRAAGAGRPVRLTRSCRVSSPVALGLLRWEICVPERVLTDLSAAQQEAMLAHELAHLVRGDPLRLLLCRLVEIVFFCQPLNRLARRRLFETIECRCDAWAIRLLGQGLSLADCLTRVATWITGGNRPAGAVAMAQAGSALARRVHRLLSEEDALAEDRRRKRCAPLFGLLLPVLVLVAPVVSTAELPAAPEPADENAQQGPAELLPAPCSSVAPAASGRSLLAAQAAEFLEGEITLLSEEMAGLRAMLPARRIPVEINSTLLELERRLVSLKRRRAVLATWRREVLREHGLDLPQPVDENHSTSPWSIER